VAQIATNRAIQPEYVAQFGQLRHNAAKQRQIQRVIHHRFVEQHPGIG
jgi:hypothetical protein